MLVLLAALTASAADLPATPAATAALSLGDALLSRRPLLVENVESLASQAALSYFDANALVGLGALALAIGGLAAAAALRAARSKGGEVIAVDFNKPRAGLNPLGTIGTGWRSHLRQTADDRQAPQFEAPRIGNRLVKAVGNGV